MHTIYEQRNSVLEMCVFTFRYYNECAAFILNQSISFFYLTVASNNYNYTAMVSKKHHENT